MATALLTDDRVRTINEVITGMRVVKFQAWEVPFISSIRNYRHQESRKVLSANLIRGYNLAFFFAATTVVSYLTFLPYYLEGNRLDAFTAFYVIALFAAARFTVALKIPLATHGLSELRVACTRIERMLRLPDRQLALSGASSLPAGSVALSNVTASWTDTNEPVVRSLSLEIAPGQTVGVIGPVGAGKSTLLMLLLHELECLKGTVTAEGSISFAAQTPWILSKTLRENIVFGLSFDEERYHRVVNACALRPDLEQLPAGDSTVVGVGCPRSIRLLT
jgi:ABC-type multidrug transport system fused ATPase/permease subunit